MFYINFYKVYKSVLFVFAYLFFLILLIESLLRIIVFVNSIRNNPGKLYNSDKYTIVCIGDSFTYGWGIDTLFTYPKQLERVLNDSKISIKEFKVFNLGIPGSNSSQHLNLIGEIVTAHNRPDLIILLTGANDSWNLADSNLDKFVKKGKVFDSLIIKTKILLANLKIYNMLKVIFLNIRGLTKESEIDPFKIIPKYENMDSVILKKLLEYNLSRIISLCRDKQVKIILQNYPRGDLYGDNFIEKFCLLNKIPFVDNYSTFNIELNSTRFRDLYLYDNSHPSQKGYTIMVNGLYRSILTQILK